MSIRTSSGSKNDRLFENVNNNGLNYTSDRIEFIKIMLEDTTLHPMFTETKMLTNEGLTKGIKEEESKLIRSTKDHIVETNDIRRIFYKPILNFVTTLSSFGHNLMYVKSGTTGHTFKSISMPDSSRPDMMINCAIKVVAYDSDKKYGSIYNAARPENAELVMLKLLSYFVVKRHTPHIILPIATFNTKIQTFIELDKKQYVSSKKFSKFIENYNKGDFHDIVSVIIEEWADGGDLLQYLRTHYKTLTVKQWRVICFQVISPLVVIQSTYETFRHNDNKANNWLVQNISETESKASFVNIINDNNYYVPNIGIRCKLCDFDFACIPGIVENSKVNDEWTDKINIKPEGHQYYDVHYFFNTLVSEGFLPDFFGHDSNGNPFVPNEVTEFIKRVIPSQIRTGKNVSESGRLLVSYEKMKKIRGLYYYTPEQILRNDPFFAKMRNEKTTEKLK
jgi:hypothetical protein